MAVPDPLMGEATVANDPETRTLSVKAAESTGYAAVLWCGAVRALLAVEDTAGYWRGPATVYGLDARRRTIARSVPDADGSLKFTFAVGDPNYKAQVSTPDLAATYTVDRASGDIMNVRFLGRVAA